MQSLVRLMHVQLHMLNAFIFQFAQGTGCNFSSLKFDVWVLAPKGAGFHAQEPAGRRRGARPWPPTRRQGRSARQVHPTATG